MQILLYSSFFDFSLIFKKTKTGVAIKIEEYVPINIPQIIAKLKSFIMLPPKINKASNAKIVVAVVFIVLDKVFHLQIYLVIQ